MKDKIQNIDDIYWNSAMKIRANFNGECKKEREYYFVRIYTSHGFWMLNLFEMINFETCNDFVLFSIKYEKGKGIKIAFSSND